MSILSILEGAEKDNGDVSLQPWRLPCLRPEAVYMNLSQSLSGLNPSHSKFTSHLWSNLARLRLHLSTLSLNIFCRHITSSSPIIEALSLLKLCYSSLTSRVHCSISSFHFQRYFEDSTPSARSLGRCSSTKPSFPRDFYADSLLSYQERSLTMAGL